MESLWRFIESDGIFIARLVAAMVLGGVIGFERQLRGRPAGLRTNILVCLGSAAVIVAFQKLYAGADPGVESAIRMDPARAAAGVITGIGFLGAGTIIKSQDFVRGLTTAACIWVVSAVGIILGLGEYVIAVALTALIVLTLFVLHRISVLADRYASLRLEWVGELSLLAEVTQKVFENKIVIKHRSVSRQPKTGFCTVTLKLRYRDTVMMTELIELLQSDERFDEVSWS